MGITVQKDEKVSELSLMTGIESSMNKAIVYKLQVASGIVSSFKVQSSLVEAILFVHSPNPTLREKKQNKNRT